MHGLSLSENDLRQLAERGLSPADASRQLELLARPTHYLELDRACTAGDGIRRLAAEEIEMLRAVQAEAAERGRFHKFVPSSGAASRMFQSLLSFRSERTDASWAAIRAQAQAGDPHARELVLFLEGLARLPFQEDLARELGRRGVELAPLLEQGVFRPILDALLDRGGLDYSRLPKGLIRFHRHPRGARTALEEQLVEAALYVRDASRLCRIHFTISPEHRARFEDRFQQCSPALERHLDVRFEMTCSIQRAGSDTLSADSAGRLRRDDQGRMLFRPGGHGALLENLNELEADLVYVKNIDNVQPDRRKPLVTAWKQALGGLLVLLERRSHDYLKRLQQAEPPATLVDEALEFVGRDLSAPLDPRQGPLSYQCKRAFLIQRLNRPIRVCGMVPNTGEPGGGPFWVRGENGVSELQIVESAQVDPANARQVEILRSASHFNPVDLVCAVRDAARKPFDLSRFVDAGAAIVTAKSEAGQEIRALERPGLWNGGMARWNTVFVEVPAETFSPVKTITDLLREEHQ